MVLYTQTDAEFDSILRRYEAAFRAEGRRYSSLAFNCYDFVVGAINALSFSGSMNHTKESLAVILEPPVIAVVQIITIARALTVGAHFSFQHMQYNSVSHILSRSVLFFILSCMLRNHRVSFPCLHISHCCRPMHWQTCRVFLAPCQCS